MQIQPAAKNFIDKILVNETKKEFTSIQIQFNPIMESGGSTINLEPANRAEKKDAQIIIDVKKNAAQDNWNQYNGDEKIIVLDPGHGGSDAGAIGPTGVTEKSVSLAVSLKTQKLLADSGYQVVMTRTTDVDVAAPGVSDATELQARVNKAPPNAALFISVHCNAFSNGKANGMETYHAPTAVKGARLARLLNEELERLGGLNNRGVKAARFYVMTHSQCPASLIELGFITNPREEKLLASDEYQQKLAQAITNAVNRYFNQGGFD
ncbi:MAG: N-acetylmuramoyl-L-alanine amidase [Selenomonadaceae bacterium]|nr:N-acetylmuramoyl-L-alanine amidase [Selenomonadaceae bacterium]